MIFNCAATVVCLVEAETSEEAENKMLDRLIVQGWEIYDRPHDTYPGEPGVKADF